MAARSDGKTTMKVLFVWPNKDSFGFKPIGLSLLSAIARNLEWNTRLFDTTGIDLGYIDNTESGQAAKIFKPVDLSPYDLTKKKIDLHSAFFSILKDYEPDCVAFTVLSDEYFIAGLLSQIVKEFNAGLPVIWGGKYPTLNPAKTLQEYKVDYVCVGEGLDAFREFLTLFTEKDKLCKIPNIWTKVNGSIVQNKIRPLRLNLDDLPFADWDIFDKRQFVKPFNGKAYVGGDHMLNWGCPYHCTYCINHFYHELYNNKYAMRRYSISRIIEELKYLKNKYKLEFFKFHDEDFLMRPIENLRELSRAYRREVNLPFVLETNPKSVTEEKVRLLKEMNCVSASVAIESGNLHLREKILNRIDSKEDILRAFQLFKAIGIRTSSFNMLGIPYESRETFMETVELNRMADVQYPSIGFFFPFEGTVLRQISIDGGFFDNNAKDSVYKHDKPSLRFKDLREKDLRQMRNVFVLYVKLPKLFWPFIRKSEDSGQTSVKLRKKILEIYEETVWLNNGWYKNNGLVHRYLKELEEIASEKITCV